MRADRRASAIVASGPALLVLALSALPASAAASVVTRSQAISRSIVAQPTASVVNATAVLKSSGIYVATTASGSSIAGVAPFTYSESRSVAANGDVSFSASATYGQSQTKAQILADATKTTTDQTTMFAQLSIAAGQDAAGAASVWGAAVGARVTQLKALAGAKPSASLAPARPLPSPAVSSGCGSRTVFAPITGYTNNNEITLNVGAFSCLDYTSGGDWYVAESLTESYETHSHGWYTYYPRTETANHYHPPTGGNRYLDWSPFTATPSITGCSTRGISIGTVSGASYSTIEDYCDGRISPWQSNGGSLIYAGTRFDCTTGWPFPICLTSADTWYGQHSEGYLHSPPAASYSSGHSIGWGSVNQYDVG